MSCNNDARITLAPMVVGDTFDELTCSMTSTGSALDSNLTTVTLTWTKDDGTAGPILTSTGAAGITITSAANWQWKVNEITTDTRTVGQWVGKVLAVDADGKRKTRQTIYQKVTARP